MKARLLSFIGVVLFVFISVTNMNSLAQVPPPPENVLWDGLAACPALDAYTAIELSATCAEGDMLCSGTGELSGGTADNQVAIQSAQDGTPGTMALHVDANLPDALGDLVYIAIGDVTLENTADASPGETLSSYPVTVNTGGQNLRIRYAPWTTARILATVPNGTDLLADAFSKDGNWVRVAYEDRIAWVSRDFVTGLPQEGLPVVELTDRTWMQSFNLSFGDDTACHPSMLLIQAPFNIPTLLTINGQDLLITSTIVLEKADSGIRVTVVEGTAFIGMANLINRALGAAETEYNDLLLPAIQGNAIVAPDMLGYHGDALGFFSLFVPVFPGQWIETTGAASETGDDWSLPVWNDVEGMQKYPVLENIPSNLLNYDFISPAGIVAPDMLEMFRPDDPYLTTSGEALSEDLCDTFEATSPLTSLRNGFSTAFTVSDLVTPAYRFVLTNDDTGNSYERVVTTPWALFATSESLIGASSTYSWYAEALDFDGNPWCRTETLTIGRGISSTEETSPEATATPEAPPASNDDMAHGEQCQLLLPVDVSQPFEYFRYQINLNKFPSSSDMRSVWMLSVDRNGDGKLDPDEVLYTETDPIHYSPTPTIKELEGLSQPTNSGEMSDLHPLNVEFDSATASVRGVVAPMFFQDLAKPFSADEMLGFGVPFFNGLIGEDGMQSLIGEDGLIALIGEDGMQSLIGEDGLQSLIGEDGLVALIGEDGMQSLIGEDGLVALIGEDGSIKPISAQWHVGFFTMRAGLFRNICLDDLDINITTSPYSKLLSPSANPSTGDTASCGTFAITSPTTGLAYGPTTFYWDPAPAATDYRVTISGAGASLAYSEIAAPNTSTIIDTGKAIGDGISFTVTVEALSDGRVICQDSLQLPREAAPYVAPVQSNTGTGQSSCNNNQICDWPNETPNNCPNDCPVCLYNNKCDPWETNATCPNDCP